MHYLASVICVYFYIWSKKNISLFYVKKKQINRINRSLSKLMESRRKMFAFPEVCVSVDAKIGSRKTRNNMIFQETSQFAFKALASTKVYRCVANMVVLLRVLFSSTV